MAAASQFQRPFSEFVIFGGGRAASWGGDGYELAEAARRLGVPTLLVSGHPEAIVEAEARGHPFLAKPFQLSELQRVIRTLIESGP